MFRRAETSDHGFGEAAYIADLRTAFEAAGRAACCIKTVDRSPVTSQGAGVSVDRDPAHCIGDARAYWGGIERWRQGRLRTPLDSRSSWVKC